MTELKKDDRITVTLTGTVMDASPGDRAVLWDGHGPLSWFKDGYLEGRATVQAPPSPPLPRTVGSIIEAVGGPRYVRMTDGWLSLGVRASNVQRVVTTAWPDRDMGPSKNYTVIFDAGE